MIGRSCRAMKSCPTLPPMELARAAALQSIPMKTLSHARLILPILPRLGTPSMLIIRDDARKPTMTKSRLRIKSQPRRTGWDKLGSSVTNA